MKKTLAIALLILITMTLVVGCGGQSGFEQAKHLIEETFDSLEANVNDMLSIISDGIDIDEISEFEQQMNAIHEEIGNMLISVDTQLSELNLTRAEEDQLGEHAEYRMGTFIERLMELQERMNEIASAQ